MFIVRLLFICFFMLLLNGCDGSLSSDDIVEMSTERVKVIAEEYHDAEQRLKIGSVSAQLLPSSDYVKYENDVNVSYTGAPYTLGFSIFLEKEIPQSISIKDLKVFDFDSNLIIQLPNQTSGKIIKAPSVKYPYSNFSYTETFNKYQDYFVTGVIEYSVDNAEYNEQFKVDLMMDFKEEKVVNDFWEGRKGF